jgi:hypothetical protein
LTESEILQTAQRADVFLLPSDGSVQHLKDIEPIYSATFTFCDPGGHFQLSVEWQQSSDNDDKAGNMDLTSKKWTRLERDSFAPSSLLDISLCDLTTSSAWQFDILACPQVVEEVKLPHQLVTFSRSLKIDAKVEQKEVGDLNFVSFAQCSNFMSVQQRISYQYVIANSDFTLEFCRYQDRSTTPSTTTTPLTQPSITVYEPRWSVRVFRKAWDAMLAKNERLPIGEEADWPHDVATWFNCDIGPGAPDVSDDDPNQGWEQLLEKLGRVRDLVKQAKITAEEKEARNIQNLLA